MQKTDIAKLRKEFKLDNDKVVIKEMYNVYVQKETGEIYHEGTTPFNMLELEQQEMFLDNFKKVLSGSLDSKLFDLKFQRDVEDSTQSILYDGLNALDVEEFKTEMLKIVKKMFSKAVYSMDVVVTFIRGEYRKPVTKNNAESEKSDNDEVYYSQFVLCSVNKTEQPQKALLFDYVEKTFKSNGQLDPFINLKSPLVGFLFPTFNGGSVDVNHILYAAGKSNQPDSRFIEDVLNCHDIVTADEDKSGFEKVIRKVVGDKVDSRTLANIYEEVNKIVVESDEEEDEPMLDHRDVERILEVSGVEQVKDLEHTFADVFDNERYELKASNLVPGFTSKSIKINTKVANIAVSPQELKNVRHITHNGRKCLLIEVDEDVMVEGFTLEEEKL